ncbi:MAG: SpoIID/LytB domain-containing protein, partial [Acidobacteriota bacterium]
LAATRATPATAPATPAAASATAATTTTRAMAPASPQPPASAASVAAAADAALRAASGSRVVRVGVALANGGVRIDTVPIEEYVSRVISGEGQPRAGAAAQEALAIVIRTFALANQHRHRAEGYDLCDSTHCQVMRPALPLARAAALATAGRVLLDKGQPAFVYYSANCGGIPALASEVWPGAVDYRPGDPRDDACEDEPAWTNQLTVAQIERVLRAAGLDGRLKSLAVAERTTSNRAGRLKAEGFTPSTLSAYEFRMAVGRTLGWQLVRSTAFELTRTDLGYRFHGTGYGHGVGLCVVGAGRRAARGESATQILRAYFGDLAESTVPAPTTELRAAPPLAVPPRLAIAAPPVAAPAAPTSSATDIRLVLPPEHERERMFVTELARRARSDVATRAGVPAPAPIGLTFHPSVEAFGRATGQPWWVAAATVGTDIDFTPLDDLRRRGTLESTLRQEVAHVVLDGLLRTRPAWVREGASLFFSAPESPPAPPGARVSCPSDAELLRPVSGGAEREAFSRADRCFRRQIAQGRGWRDVR